LFFSSFQIFAIIILFYGTNIGIKTIGLIGRFIKRLDFPIKNIYETKTAFFNSCLKKAV